MNKALVYVIGPPAVGKSALMRALTVGLRRQPTSDPLAHDRLLHPDTGVEVAVELGKRRRDYPGTDTLPMNVAPVAYEWVQDESAPALMLAEGDRLAHMAFLSAARTGGYAVTLVALEAPLDVLDGRCAARGSTQDPSWRRSRATKAARLAETAAASGYPVVTLQTADPPDVLAARLCRHVPALAVLAVDAVTVPLEAGRTYEVTW